MTVNMILYNVPVNIKTEKNINDRHTNNIYLWFINFDFVSFSLNKPRVVKFGKVYGCNLGKNIGSEQNGKSRPVVILQKDSPNSPTVIVAPLTDAHDVNGNLKTIYPTHVLVKDPNLTKESIIKLEHIRSVSKNRLTEYMTDLNDNKGVIKEIEEKLKDMLCIK